MFDVEVHSFFPDDQRDGRDLARLRQLTQLGPEVIVAHARNVRLIGESSRKDDPLDARTLARLARIDPELLGPVRHRSAKAQIRTASQVVGQRRGLRTTAEQPQSNGSSRIESSRE
jgi:hypothetical protein